MMKCLLKNKKGVTILEGLIALGLLALVAGGTFGVLLSVSRKASNPDIREEMILAVERANEQLQKYTGKNTLIPDDFKNGLCGGDSAPLSTGSSKHSIKCMLPAICDRDNSSFTYTVSHMVTAKKLDDADRIGSAPNQTITKIDFDIECNGFTL